MGLRTDAFSARGLKILSALAVGSLAVAVASGVAAPVVNSITPNTGVVGAGTAVTVSGTGFTGATAVKIASSDFASFTVVNDTTITGTLPAGSSGVKSISVTTAAGTGTLSAAFTYTPSVTTVSPNIADTAGGGGAIRVNGTGFVSGCTCTIGGVAGAVTFVSSSAIDVVPGAHAAGTVDVVVTNPDTLTTGTTGASKVEYWIPAQITGVDAYLDSSKGVTASAGAVGTWTSQSTGAVAFSQATGANKPTQVAAVFGTLPSIRFDGADWLDASAARLLASGLTFFFVGKTSTNFAAAAAPAFNAPGTVVGGSSPSSWGGFGFDSGAGAGARYTMYDSAGGTSYPTARGSGLNDGTTRLIGVTSNTTPDVKIYVGATQQGATNSPAGGYSAAFTSYQTIGAGYTGADGFNGDLGAVVVVSGVISSGDLTKLYAWSKQRFGAA